MPPFLQKHWTLIALVVIMLVAGVLRLYKTDFDQNSGQHPDERHISDTTQSNLRWPAAGVPLDQLFDPKLSPLNIRISHVPPTEGQAFSYDYGTLPVYLVKLAGATVMQGTIGEGQYGGFTLIGRRLAGIFDLITVLLVFLIARRLFGKVAGLLAAAFSALAVTQIQIAHFFISEPFLVMFMTATLYFSVVLMQNRKWWAAALAGLMLGFALACKVSIVPLALVIVVALILRSVNRRRTRKLGPPADLDDPYGLTPASAFERRIGLPEALGAAVPLLILAGITTVVGLFIGDPFAILDSGLLISNDPNSGAVGTLFFSLGNLQFIAEQGKYLQQLGAEAAIQSGVGDVPYTLQYIGRTPFLDNIQQVITWGMALPVGLISVAGVLLAIWFAIRGKAAEILLLSGILPYYLSIATLEAKWMRYMLPLVPYLCILAGALLARGLAWSVKAWRNRSQPNFEESPGRAAFQRWAFPVLTTFAVLSGVIWATAFFRIYTVDHSRIQARAWANGDINTGQPGHVPADAIVSHESWDDSVPAGQDTSFELYTFHTSDDEFTYIQTMLNQLDWITITSNRLYMSIPRLPWRYPVQTRFYQLLFAGKLGFELEHTSAVYPQIFGIDIVDDYADESFTVYDHPKVLFYKKVRSLSDDEMRTLFGDVINRPAFELRHFNNPEDKSIMLPEPVGQQVALNDYAWNSLADNQWVALVLFLLAVEVFGLLAWPIAAVVGRRLPDRGYPLAKLIGLVLVAWPVWMLASLRLVPFTVWSILIGMALVGLLSFLLWRRFAAELRAVWRTHRKLILAWEAVFLVAFALFTLVRLLDPDLWQPWNGGEKPMEFGFLNAVYRSPWMPAYDPFFSGGTLNYYYYGYFILAMLMKIVGVDPSVGFNLAIPVLYGLLALAGGSVVYNVIATIQRSRGWRSNFSGTAFGFALLGVLMAQAIGNLSFMLQFISITLPNLQQALVTFVSNYGPVPAAMATAYQNFDWWGASRITTHTGSVTINEFPYWSFLFADLHPHLINMAFTLLVVALAFSLLLGAWRWPLFRSVSPEILDMPVDQHPAPGALARSGSKGVLLAAIVEATKRLWGSEIPDALLRYFVTALALGTLFVINSWDYVTYAGLILGAILVVALAAWQASPARSALVRMALPIAGAISVIAVAGGALLLYLPFFIGFKALFTDIKTITDPALRTELPAFIVVWGLFIFITISYLGLQLLKYPWSAGLADIRGWLQLPRPSPAPARATFGPAAPAAPMTPAVSATLEEMDAPLVRRTVRTAPAALAEPPHSNGNGAAEPEELGDYSPEVNAAVASALDQDELEHFRRPLVTNGNGDAHSYDLSMVPADGAEYEDDDTAVDTSTRRSVPLESEPRNPIFTMRVPPPTNGDGDHEPAADAPQEEAAPDADAYETSADEPAAGYETATDEPATSLDWQASATHLEEHASTDNFVVEDADDDEPPARPPRRPLLGLLPSGAGIVIMGLTGLIFLLLLQGGSPLLALLALLIGGLIGTHFGAVRNPGSLFGGLLLVTACIVVMGVELVYLADHLAGGDAFRMNTVFKFYIQAWALFATGGAVALYWLLGPKGSARITAARRRYITVPLAALADTVPTYNDAQPIPQGAMMAAADEAAAQAATGDAIEPEPLADTTPAYNDIQPIPQVAMMAATPEETPVWNTPEGAESADAIEEAGTVEHDPDEIRIVDVPDDEPIDQPVYEPQPEYLPHQALSTLPTRRRRVDVSAAPAEPSQALTPVATAPIRVKRPAPQWTWPRVVWAPLFALLLLGSLIFTVAGTQARVADRMPGARPDFGTLDGSDWMKKTTLTLDYDSVQGTIVWNFELQALDWLNKNIGGTPAIAAAPREYYREGGMIVGTYTGLPMVVGGLHQDEQRYGWQVGERRSDINGFYMQDSVEHALAVISKYDIGYIYVGQIEHTVYFPSGGLAKFEDMTRTGPDGKPVLSIAYKNDAVTIYKVLDGAAQQVGGAAGTIRVEPTPRPTPTEPALGDDPQLNILLTAVAGNPSDTGARLALGDYYREHGAVNKAIEQYEAVVKLDPSNVPVQHMLGDMYMDQGQKDKALAIWQQAAENAGPGDKPAAYNKLGIGYRDIGHFDDAITAFQAALQSDPTFVEASYQLGQVYESMVDKDRAVAAYEYVLKNAKNDDSGNSWKDRAQERLNVLK